jgi:hypothetical protein
LLSKILEYAYVLFVVQWQFEKRAMSLQNANHPNAHRPANPGILQSNAPDDQGPVVQRNVFTILALNYLGVKSTGLN